MFYKLLSEYGVGGNFLKPLQSLYDNHEVYVRLSEGLLQPISTTIGVKQGCGLSPLLFNIFINKLPEIFDKSCDPVKLENLEINSLLWADDLVILSESGRGLQNSIDKTFLFYQSLGLELNTKKTKVLIFSCGGRLRKDFVFLAGGSRIEIVDSYQYLGIKLKSSGSMQLATDELFAKANRAWFAISNVLFQHKKLAVAKALQLFDSLIKPIFLYATEFWLPFIVTKKGFESQSNLLKFWENFQPELLNQKVCRLLLSVHKRCSRLAVLGELGRYPVFIPALRHCLKYQHHIDTLDRNSLISKAISEMKSNPEIDSWFSRVERIKVLFDIKRLSGTPDRVSLVIDKMVKSKFERFYLNEINNVKLGSDGQDHNKLRFYKRLKGSFKVEPYIVKIKNRNQRQWLTRFRTSAHTLCIETGRYTRPVTPISDRKCVYCDDEAIDDERHFILLCKTFNIKRQCFMGRMRVLHQQFENMSLDEKLTFILCPPTADIAKCVSKYLGIMSGIRREIDMGLKTQDLNYYIKHAAN